MFVSPFQFFPLTFPLGCHLTGPFCRGLCLVHHGFLSRLHYSVFSHGLRVEFRGKQEDLAVRARVEPVLGDAAFDVILQCMHSTGWGYYFGSSG